MMDKLYYTWQSRGNRFKYLLRKGGIMKIQVKDLMDNMSGIYKITFPNNKIYIGMSNDIRRRM